ncbi:MAG: hypothetical protein IT182_03130 [Acidobacteria bacterium]|nr:hypothetical protein [Acidobacteriota bacterium]
MTVWANTGGPCSRTRVEHIRRTLLNRTDGPIRMPRVLRVGLDHRASDDVADIVWRTLAAAGFATPDHLRAAFTVPAKRLLCRRFVPRARELPCLDDAPLAVLEQALLLGLCTAHLFDPSRPVVWTTASLSRQLELFEPEGFYVS